MLCVSLQTAVAGEDEELGGIQKTPSEPQKMVQLYTEKEGSTYHFFARNLQAVDLTLTIEMELENLEPSVEFPYVASCAGSETVRLFTVKHADKEKGWKWKYTYYSTWGNVAAQHDETHVYLLPFDKGDSFLVSQGFGGTYSHSGPDQYAIDFKMPTGTRVRAARDGTVVACKDDSSAGGPSEEFDWDANYILIRHDDGTVGQYAHLAPHGNQVKVGDRVKAGQWIGRSGNTGHSTGPHLHFAVFKGKTGRERETLPVRFRTSRLTAATLKEGRYYKNP